MSGFNLTLSQAARAIRASGAEKVGRTRLSGVSTDSRTIKPGELFVALKGENFDGHKFLKTAFDNGAKAAIVDKRKGIKHGPCLEVPNTLTALGDLAAFYRKKHKVKVVAVTGSMGKTGTKNMLVAILEKKYSVLGNAGSFNNLIGLPLTIFNLRREHEIAVLEMGMNVPGEISRLTEIADPDEALITGIGPVHLEGVGSIEGVAKAKGELYAGLKNGARAIYNLDDPYVKKLGQSFSGPSLSFGLDRQADVRAGSVRLRGMSGLSFNLLTHTGSAKIMLPLLGAHNVSNALAAATVAIGLGIKPRSIASALGKLKVTPGRMELKRLGNQVYLLDDSYNSSPVSARAAVETLVKIKGRGRAIAVLADMLELGRTSRKKHAEIGSFAAVSGLDMLVGVGVQARAMVDAAKKSGMGKRKLAWFKNREDAGDWLKKKLRPFDRVLIKGSRGMKLEKTVELLMNNGGCGK